ncbi:hypothetical protein CHS0354_011614 [Potamilus streckersoni]|uniref:Protein kinase domain-containing protein n=1 Tax=Potamilus streckersoni TaxID=2493646 RepID=A0AAE0WER4_9BIVA|nr:hypothetical protein CHS0354_011614 [Potamilus streckersoni]
MSQKICNLIKLTVGNHAGRDLKMENILLDEKRKHIKLIDFGLSNTYGRDELMKTHCGSLEYAAPELLAATERYGPEIDIWSIGIVLYAMVVGTLPFITHYTDQYRRQKLLQQIEKGLVETHEKEMAHLSQDCIDLLKKMLEPAPELRLPLMDIEIHPWVTNFNKMPFYPFQHLTKDKTLTSQVNQKIGEEHDSKSFTFK